MNVTAPPKFGMGASPLRVEDGSLIRGEGRYTTDVTPQGALTAYVVRSNVAHAKIKVGGLEEARAAPGLRPCVTGFSAAGKRQRAQGVPACLLSSGRRMCQNGRVSRLAFRAAGTSCPLSSFLSSFRDCRHER